MKVRNISLGFAVLTFLALAGCRQDMHNQPKYIPLRASEFFRDGRSARNPVANTVPRNSRITDTEFYKGGDVYEDNYFLTGKIGNDYGDRFPLPLTKEVLLRGQDRFNIYCSPCHSRVGDGNGMIVSRGLKHPPSYAEARLEKAPIGYFYDVMTNGFGAMLNYSAQVKPEDRWAIAAYIRALQLAQDARLSDVPEAERGKIREPLAQMPAAIIAPPGRKVTEPQSTTNEQVIGNRQKEGKR